MHETAGPSLLGPGALDFDASPLGVQPRRDRQSDVEELRASAFAGGLHEQIAALRGRAADPFGIHRLRDGLRHRFGI